MWKYKHVRIKKRSLYKEERKNKSMLNRKKEKNCRFDCEIGRAKDCLRVLFWKAIQEAFTIGMIYLSPLPTGYLLAMLDILQVWMLFNKLLRRTKWTTAWEINGQFFTGKWWHLQKNYQKAGKTILCISTCVCVCFYMFDNE